MNKYQKEIEIIYDRLQGIPVNGNCVELMAEVRARLRELHKVLDGVANNEHACGDANVGGQ